jgi:anti-sigma B factor antagonist
VQTYLRVSVREQDHSIVLEVDGELDLASSRILKQALEDAWRGRPPLLVLELGNLRFIDMSGVRVLLAAQQRAEREDARLVLANVREAVLRVMKLASVRGLFTILEDVA